MFKENPKKTLRNSLKRFFPFLLSSKTYLAFDVEESPTRYPLDKARYLNIADYIHAEHLKLKRPLRVLDVGCSEGMTLLYCRRNGTPVEFYGIDILEERKRKALERGYKEVWLRDIRQCDFREFKVGFDAVVASHIIEHMEHPGELLERLKPAMEEGALLIVGVPIGLLPFVLWRRHVTPIYNPRLGRKASLERFGHVSFFSLPELRRLLRKHGFGPEETRGDYFLRARGFFFENYKWWFDFNQWYGRLAPGIWGALTVKSRLSVRGSEAPGGTSPV